MACEYCGAKAQCIDCALAVAYGKSHAALVKDGFSQAQASRIMRTVGPIFNDICGAGAPVSKLN